MGERLYRRSPTGPWYGWIYDRAGRRRIFSTRQLDKRAALAVLHRAELAAHAGDAPVSAPAAYATHRCLDDYALAIKTLRSAATLSFVAGKLGQVARMLGDVSVYELTPERCRAYVDQRTAEGVGRETIRKELSCLRLALRMAYREGRISSDVEAAVPKLRVPYRPRVRWLREEEARRLSTALAPHRRLWFWLAIYTGARRSEVEGLAWQHIDFLGGWIYLAGTKTDGSARRVPLAPQLKTLLRPIKRESGRVVVPWGKVCRDLAVAGKRAGVHRCSPNDLRRTFASWVVQAGVPLKVVADLLGHRSTLMVDRVYGHLSDEGRRNAIAALPSIGNARAAARGVLGMGLVDTPGEAQVKQTRTETGEQGDT